MWEALTNFVNITEFKSSSDKRYLKVIYPFHPVYYPCKNNKQSSKITARNAENGIILHNDV